MERLRSWINELEDLWGKFNEMHDQLQQGREILNDTDYHKNNVFGTIKLEYDDMKANLRYFLGNANLEALNNMFGSDDEAENQLDGNYGNEENEEEEEDEEEEDALNESFRTVKTY